MIGELGMQEIEEVLRDEMVGRIGCHTRGRTYVVPVAYVYDGASILGHTGDGLKVRIMRENPAVCFEVEQLGDLPNWRSVIVYGSFVELHDDEATAALKLVTDRLRDARAVHAATPPHGAGIIVPAGEATRPRLSIVYAIRIQEKTGRYERVT